MTFIAEDAASTINLTDLSVGVFTQAVQNIATPACGQRSLDVQVAFRR